MRCERWRAITKALLPWLLGIIMIFPIAPGTGFALAPESAFEPGNPNPASRYRRKKERLAILSGNVEPSFWMGGKTAPIYRGLKVKAEVKVMRLENVSEKLWDLKDRLGLKGTDVVLVYYHDIPPSSTVRPQYIRIMAAPLGKFMDAVIRQELGIPFSNSSSPNRFAHLLFERSLEIEPAHKKIINLKQIFLRPALRGRGWASELLAYQADVFEKYFPGYTIRARAGHWYTLWTFLHYYDADLVLEDHGAVLAAGGLDALVSLGLLSSEEAKQLQNHAARQGRGIFLRDVSRKLQKKWAPYGEGNALKGVVQHLEEVAKKIGLNKMNAHLDRLGGIKIQGNVPKSPRPRNRYRDSLRQQLNQQNGLDRVESSALAPESSFLDRQEEPAPQADQQTPQQQFLTFLEQMRGRAAMLEHSRGQKVYRIIVDKNGFVLAYIIGRSKAEQLGLLPAHAQFFMEQSGLEILRLPMDGLYAPKVQEAITSARAQQAPLLRWMPHMGRRGFLGLMGYAAKSLITGEAPSAKTLVEGISSMLTPVRLEYASRPLSRAEELVRAFALDNILGIRGQFITPVIDMASDPEASDLEQLLKSLDRRQLPDRYDSVESQLHDRRDYLEVKEVMHHILALGAADMNWIRTVRDAIACSSLPLRDRRNILEVFNQQYPEMAISMGILEYGKAMVLGPAADIESRMKMDEETRDLDHLECEALRMTKPSGEAGAFLEDFLYDDYRSDRMMDMLGRFYEEGKISWTDNPANHDVMHEMLPLMIEARGGCSATGITRLRQIIAIYRKAIETLLDGEKMPLKEKLQNIVDGLEKTMREAPLKLQADQEGREEDIAKHASESPQEYTILDSQGRTFEQVLQAYRDEEKLRTDILDEIGMEGMDANDPRTWGVLATEDPNLVISLSKMSLHELAIMLRRMAENYGGVLKQLAKKHSANDLDLLRGYLDILGSVGLPEDRRGHDFVHLVPSELDWRVRYLEHLKAAQAKGEPTKPWEEKIQRADERIAITREIIRRWVRPDEFDFEKNAISRIVERKGKRAAISRHMDSILGGDRAPNFWLGGPQSLVMQALGVKAEITIQRAENILERIGALASEKQLNPDDIVLVCYKDPYKTDNNSRWDDYDRIHLVAAPLKSLQDAQSRSWIETTQNVFAYKALAEAKQPIPFLFEQTLAIEPAFQRHIRREAIYLDESLQGRGLGYRILDQGRSILEEYFDKFTISTVVGNLLTAQTFLAFYNADLWDGTGHAGISPGAIYSAYELWLLDNRDSRRLNNYVLDSEFGTVSHQALNECIRKQAQAEGQLNTLAWIVTRLEERRDKIGNARVNELLFRSPALLIQGTVSKQRARDTELRSASMPGPQAVEYAL